MKLGEIVSELFEKRLRKFDRQINEEISKIEESFISSSVFQQKTISPILLITDEHPRSIIAIAYALRIAEVLPSDLFVFTKGFHDELIKEETKDMKINIRSIETKKDLEVKDVEDFVKLNEIGLVVLPFNHNLREKIQTSVKTAILTTKIQRFIK